MAQITASMAGTVLSIVVSENDEIEEGQDVVILESMKMEVPIAAEVAGKIQKIHVEPGDFVNEGDVLIDMD